MVTNFVYSRYVALQPNFSISKSRNSRKKTENRGAEWASARSVPLFSGTLSAFVKY
jgi:hypothetical protein